MLGSIMGYIRNFSFLGGFLALSVCAACDEPCDGNCYFPEPSFEEYVEFWDRVYLATPDDVDLLWYRLNGVSYLEWRKSITLPGK